MAFYIVTGRLGSGKSLAAVSRAWEYGMLGRRIVANFHLDISSLARRSGTRLAASYVEVIPSRPSAADLAALGRGGKSEHDAGLIILDECSSFLNARQWQKDADRQRLIDWFKDTRKLGWDVMLIVQHAGMLDKQIRDAFGEMFVTVRRLDKMAVPIISWIFPGIHMPRVHIAVVRYGPSSADPTADRWVFRGNRYFPCYDTQWIQANDVDMGAYCTLSANLARFRYRVSAWKRFRVWMGWDRPAARVNGPKRADPLKSMPADKRWELARQLVNQGVL